MTEKKLSIPREEEESDITDMIKAIVWAGILALIIRILVFEPFNIPSGSMLPNLLVGDYIFVSKYTYGYSRYSFPDWASFVYPGKKRVFSKAPERGDVIVFRQPKSPQHNYIKRLIGLPGDRVQMIGGLLYVNGDVVPRAIVGTTDVKDNGSFVVATEYEENLPGGVKHRILEMSDLERLDETEEFHVPKGFYFFMGDNRDSSLDSRATEHVGLVPEENLVGKARFIFFSIESAGGKCVFEDGPLQVPAQLFCNIARAPGAIRWDRIFNAIH